jgi:DNA-binding FadR family transcriptional regulator
LVVSLPPETHIAVRVSRAELVARELEREIGEERAPGDRLGTKEDLRLRFGVAVATVNEAVRLLETRGLIEARPGPGGGVFVARREARLALSHAVLGFTPGATSYAECLEVRDALEPLVAYHAARYHRVADIRSFQRVLVEMEAAGDDPAAFFTANYALHRQIAGLCRNAPLRGMYLMLIDYLDVHIDHVAFAGFDGKLLLKVHQDLVAAIDKGEGPHLDMALEAHRPTAPLRQRRRRRAAGSARS